METQEPSKVIHVHNVGHEISKADLIDLFRAFGGVKIILMFPAKNQALLELQDVQSAFEAIKFYATNQPQIRGRNANVHIQYSIYENLIEAKGDKVADSMLTPSISICWDNENGTVRSGIGPYTAAKRVRDAMWARFPGVPIKHFVGFGNKTGFSDMQREEYSRINVQIFDVPTEKKNAADMALMLEMFKIAIDIPPPAFFMLISSDADFCQTLIRLKELGYTTLLSYNENRIAPEFKSSIDWICDWDMLCEGHGFKFIYKDGNTISSSLLLKPAPVVCDVPLESSKKTGVFWNLMSFPLPGEFAYYEASIFIGTSPEFEIEISEYKAYGFKSKFPKNRRGFAVSYIETTPKLSDNKIKSINNVMLADIMTFAHKNRPPCSIILATGDQDLCPVVLFLRERNYSVTVVIPSETKDSDLPDLRDAATRVIKCPVWSDRQSAARESINTSISKWNGRSGQSATWVSNNASNSDSRKENKVTKEWRVKPSQ